MSTILELVEMGRLIKFDPDLEPDQQEDRYFYVAPTILPKLQKELPAYVSDWKLDQRPLDQFEALMTDFCSGDTLYFFRTMKPLIHIQDGVWELKTPDLRLFGWFPVKDCFIMGEMGLATSVKRNNLYEAYVNMVADWRKQLDLDEPKFIPGKDPNDVVSNYDFPQRASRRSLRVEGS